MRKLASLTLLASLVLLPACAHRSAYGPVDDGLALETVVLYRNGVGYFERRGEVDDDSLTIKVRKDQVNDLLKSLTVVDENGRALSVSMPLDPQTWANAALATLQPGRGSLAQVLDALRGTNITVRTPGRIISGRIVMVEEVFNEPIDPPNPRAQLVVPYPGVESHDYKLTLLSGDRMDVVKLSRVKSLTLEDGDLAMQLNRRLDASAGEGMFEQVEVKVRLATDDGAKGHRLLVSYVVPAPMWKPTYRVVLPEGGKGQALLQGWAVVDNISGEDWHQVELSVTSGAPISFQYDLHTPRDVYRTDLTEEGVRKQARVSVGETSYGQEIEEEPAAAAAAEEMADDDGDYYADEDQAQSREKSKKRSSRSSVGGLGMSGSGRGGGGSAAPPPPAPKAEPAPSRRPNNAPGGGMAGEGEAAGPSLDYDALRRSTQASARAQQVSGLTRIDLPARVTVPDGSSTMVALINEQVEAEETFLYRPGGAGQGYESNPYRVVRFRNTTPYVLEPGPISIYSGGSFVGEGLSETVGAKTSVTIPFAVESSILVERQTEYAGQEMKLTRIVRGVLEVESFSQTKTTWTAKRAAAGDAKRVLIRHPRAGQNYTLAERPDETEDLDGAYLVPLPIPKGKATASLTLVEQTPSTTSLSIFDGRAPELLEELMASAQVDAKTRKRLQTIVDKRREIGKIDTKIDGLRRQQVELDKRANETRQNLEAIKKDPAAGGLRSKLNKRLDEFTKEADQMGRDIVELNSKRLELKIELEDELENFDFRVPKQDPDKGKSKAKSPKADKK